MSKKYFDMCDRAFSFNPETLEVLAFHVVDGEVVEEKPSDYEMSIFWRHFHDGGIISEEIAKALAINPGLSY